MHGKRVRSPPCARASPEEEAPRRALWCPPGHARAPLHTGVTAARPHSPWLLSTPYPERAFRRADLSNDTWTIDHRPPAGHRHGPTSARRCLYQCAALPLGAAHALSVLLRLCVYQATAIARPLATRPVNEALSIVLGRQRLGAPAAATHPPVSPVCVRGGRRTHPPFSPVCVRGGRPCSGVHCGRLGRPSAVRLGGGLVHLDEVLARVHGCLDL